MAERLASLKRIRRTPATSSLRSPKRLNCSLRTGSLNLSASSLRARKFLRAPDQARTVEERLMLGEIATLLGRFPEVKEFAAFGISTGFAHPDYLGG